MKKFLCFSFLLMLSFSSSFALDEVIFHEATKSFSGTFTLIAFFQSCGIIVFAIGVLTSVKLALNAFRSPYGGRGRY